jgi:hypothetical protein
VDAEASIKEALGTHTESVATLSLQDKVRLADQLIQNRKYLARVNHMSEHPGDLVLRLFRYGLAIFLAYVTAQVLFVLRSKFFDDDVTTVLGLGLVILLLSGVACFESITLSAKNIAATKARIEKSIAEAEAKLGALTP